MLKRLIPLVVLAGILLSACQPKPAQVSGEPMPGCSVASSIPQPNPTVTALFRPVDAQDHIRGPQDAKVTIIEYSDFQCPYCGVLSPVLKQLSEKYPKDVRIIYRHFPLTQIHPNSVLMAQAAEAAALQDKFLEMDEAIFADQAAWSTLSEAQATEYVAGLAKKIGLDETKFLADLKSDAVKARVELDRAEAEKAGVPGTPFLLINGNPWQQASDLATLSGLVELFKLDERQFTACPPMVIDAKKTYEATLKTSKGDIVIRLFADKAPSTVNSFVFLAEKGWYNNVPFHRVLQDFVAQAGDPTGTGFGGPGYQFITENLTAKFDKEGVLGMARGSETNTNGSQFFITLAATPNLDGQYTVFGEVVKGMDVVKQLTLRDPSSGAELPDPDVIQSVTISAK